MKRVLLAALLGGLALFMWGAVSHMMLGLGNVGLESIPRPVYDALKTSVPHAGAYLFPEYDMKSATVRDEFKNGPIGIVTFKPTGAGASMSGQLINEAILNVIQAFFAAFLLALAAVNLPRYPQRVGFVFGLGILTAIATNIEYWIWYSFPSNYTMAAMVDKLLGFLVVGLIVAALVKPAAAVMKAVPARAA